MNSTPLDYYVRLFSTLRRASLKKEQAPHKPVLLLSILYLYEKNHITGNQIFLTPELTHTFSVFWDQLVPNTPFTKGFVLPFYHLQNEKGHWWRLIAKPGYEEWLQETDSIKSFTSLSAAVVCAEIEHALAHILVHPQSRCILQQALLQTYFSPQANLPSASVEPYILSLQKEVLEEASPLYAQEMKELQKTAPETYQIEVYNRDRVFQREIVRIYQHTCCMSGFSVQATEKNIAMVDACHIVPFSKEFDNRIVNGLALCPTLHRAFDRGLITLDANYQVLRSRRIKENEASIFSLKSVEGIRIQLPVHPSHYPSQEALDWHRNHVFLH